MKTLLSDTNKFLNNNEDICRVNSTGIEMAYNDYECGSASLTTVLKNMGVNTTLDEIIQISGTDISGTSMYGIINAAQIKGLISKGVLISVYDLKENNIVFMSTSGYNHFSVICYIYIYI